jgi:hypothetical protein
VDVEPPATPLLIWAARYVVAGVAAAMLSFSRRDLWEDDFIRAGMRR